jgi:23S rRNA (guanosine2251-2'-O)-methyltransferase
LKKESKIYGFKPVLEAIRSGKEIEKLFLLKTLHPSKSQEIKRMATEYSIPFQFVPKEKLNRLTRQNHQGVVALVSAVEYVEMKGLIPTLFETGRPPLILVLDKITDIRNVGSIARTAESAGVDALVIASRGSAPINEDAVKTSAGALNHLPVCRVNSLKDTIEYLKKSGIRVVGAKEETERYYYEETYTMPLALVMGSEEKGIAPDFLDLCDAVISIPMTGKIGSLNVAVAAGVLLFEVLKQRLLEK